MGTNELNYLDNLIEEMREKEAEVKAISEEIDTLKALVRDTMTTSEISEITTPTITLLTVSVKEQQLIKRNFKLFILTHSVR